MRKRTSTLAMTLTMAIAASVTTVFTPVVTQALELNDLGAKINPGIPLKKKNIDPQALKLAGVLPKVTYPAMSHQVGYDGWKFAITVRFNTDIDRTTVVAGNSVQFNFPKAGNAAGQISWISNREFIWTQQASRRLDICEYNPDCEFELILKDTILSKEGLRLDGNKDNQPGGDFQLWMIDLG